MTVTELIAKLQHHHPAVEVVLRRNIGYVAVAERVSELTPVSLLAAEGCGWLEFRDETDLPQDDHTAFTQPVDGLLLE